MALGETVPSPYTWRSRNRVEVTHEFNAEPNPQGFNHPPIPALLPEVPGCLPKLFLPENCLFLPHGWISWQIWWPMRAAVPGFGIMTASLQNSASKFHWEATLRVSLQPCHTAAEPWLSTLCTYNSKATEAGELCQAQPLEPTEGRLCPCSLWPC